MNIRVSYAEIEQAASQLASGREDITARLNAMQTQIEALVSSGFVTDQASGRFHDAYVRYTGSTASVIAQLSEIELFLKQTAQAMQDLDQQIAARLG